MDDKKKKEYTYSHLAIPLTRVQKKVIKQKCEQLGFSMSAVAKMALFEKLNIIEFPIGGDVK